MKVKDVMTEAPYYCQPETNLGSATELMWNADCGFLPVRSVDGKVVGVVTDRDICIAAATRSLEPARILVRDAMTHDVATCAEDADLRTALHALKERRVRRLPVVNRHDQLVGVLSINDLVSRADCRPGTGLPGEEFLETLRGICAHPTSLAVRATVTR